MLNNKNIVVKYLRTLNLSKEEAELYLQLLDTGPDSHLALSRLTGINRTKVYRVAEDLEKRGLVTIQTDDRGTMLAPTDPTNLEVSLVTQEETLKNQRAVYKSILPVLQDLRADDLPNPTDFVVNTYEGVEGFKQMLWNELKAKGEALIMGSGTIESLVDSKRWAEKHRERTVEAHYTIREILNPDGKPDDFTKNVEFMKKVYNKRYISKKDLPLSHQIIIYNNTVATYCWQDGQKVGYEVMNKQNAEMWRGMFESFWSLAK